MTESETNQETFGSYLQNFRVKGELALETVAARTKIAVHCLKAIEADDHSQLPPPAYVRSFVRTYAQVVGANTDLAVNLYLADLKQQENFRQQQLKRRAKVGAVRRVLMAAGIILSILLLLRYTDIGLDSIPPQRIVDFEGSDPQSISTGGHQASDTRSLDATPQEKLKLQVIAVEQTWLKVIVDGHNAKSYKLKPEDRLELEGNRNFNLMIGNATGLKILLNERPVKIFGGHDQVVSLKIP